MTRARPADQALAVPATPASAVDGPTGFDPSRSVRRTLKPFSTAPRDGEPFHILSTLRFNPAAKMFEVLVWGEDDKPCWSACNFREAREPNYFCREVPMPYEIPARKWFAFTLTYHATIKRKSRIARLWERILSRFPTIKRLMEMEFALLTISTRAKDRSGEAVETGNTDSTEGESLTAASGSAQKDTPHD